MHKHKVKKIECSFCEALIPLPLLREELGFCPECGEDLNALLPPRDNKQRHDDDEA
ncbi:MAG: hypothetical protein ACRC37_06920 [Lentisphaeria bacterium]